MSLRSRTWSEAESWITGILAALSVLGLGGGMAVHAQPCPTVPTKEELRPPQVLMAKPVPSLGPVLNTTFTVEMKDLCVPVQQNDTWVSQRMSLRTYVYPDPNTGRPTWGYTDPRTGQTWVAPGPTLLLRKPSHPQRQGDRLWIDLVNNLTITANLCESACASGTTCPSDPGKLPTPAACAANPGLPNCCCWVDRQQTWPDCFHGENVTNLHFHGTHVSPQAPQDYVLLELYSQPVAGQRPPDVHAAHLGGEVAFGHYQYKVDPLPWTQPDGTHWYHPHKHGSVALQVANGMAGALQIEGPFDDWLRGFYNGRLAEKLLVMQQIQATTNLYAQGGAPPLTINGQASPKVTMAPGEIQRWRFVNATMQSSAQVVIEFPASFTVRQIAMDGIQFAPENYGWQPLLSPPNQFKISPGNRADFLVQAPRATGLTAGKATEFPVTQRVFGALGARARQQVQLRDQGLKTLLGAPAAAAPPLFIPVVDPTRPPVSMTLPTQAQWPQMPPYLNTIPPPAIHEPNLTFSMSQTPGGPPSGQQNPASMFFINNKQYKSDCINITTKLDTANEWTILNSSPILHPFHIHTNPFQVTFDSSLGAKQPKAPYVWFDTYALPPASGGTPGRVVMRHEYTQFTGAYVLHCHFLGHEDRGMMFGVQTVCKDSPGNFGKARSDGQPECVPGNFTPAFPACK
jgi:FtsP/CotA-like multicopper oxidase with cupredoxin domain